MIRFNDEKKEFKAYENENGFKYYPVDKMLEFFYKDYPDGRLTFLKPQTAYENVAGTFVGEVKVYANKEEQKEDLPIAHVFASASYNSDTEFNEFDSASTFALSKALRLLGYGPTVEEQVIEDDTEQDKVVEEAPKAKKEEKPKKEKTSKAKKPEVNKVEKTKKTEEPTKDETPVKEEPKKETVVEEKKVGEKVETPATKTEEAPKAEKEVKAVKESTPKETNEDNSEIIERLRNDFEEVNFKVEFGYDAEAAKQLMIDVKDMDRDSRSKALAEFNRNNIPVGDEIYDVVTSEYLLKRNRDNLPIAEFYEAIKSDLSFFIQNKSQVIPKDPILYAVAVQLSGK